MWFILVFILASFTVCVGFGLLSALSRIAEQDFNRSHYLKLSAAESKLWKQVGNHIRKKNVRIKSPRIS